MAQFLHAGIGGYQVGEIVTLKSGGPEMTVREVHISDGYGSLEEGAFTGKYTCQWFAGKKLDSGVFPEESLLKVQGS